jgi:hypothetical protein
VNTQDRIQKLEALLGRVKARAAEPRVHGAPSFALPPLSARRSAALLEETAQIHGKPRVLDAPFAEDETREEPSVRPAAKASSTAPPPTIGDAHGTQDALAAAEADARLAEEVEVSSDLVEVDIDVDEAALDDDELAAAEADEAARVALLSAAAAPADELEVVTDEDDEDELDTPRPRPANEVEEPAPSSSPRPILEAAESEPSPRHTPPPESGKQVAASAPPRAPSALPPASEPSLIPATYSDAPDSLGGQTLIGGWREPGLGPGGPPGMGVRVPAPVGNMPSPVSVLPPPVTSPQGAAPAGLPAQPVVGASPGAAAGGFAGPKPARMPNIAPPPAAPAPLTAAVTSPQLAGDARVAAFAGAPPAFAPASFGELLDATLDL